MRERPYLVLLFLYCLSVGANAQQVGALMSFNYTIKVKKVDLFEPSNSPNSKIEILHDDGDQLAWSGPAWSYPDISTPIGFVSGTAPDVEAIFEGCPNTAYAYGVLRVNSQISCMTNAGNEIFKVKALSNGVYSGSFCKPFRADEVDFYENFDVEWFVSTNEDGPFISAGISSHPLYVTYKKAPPDLKIFHTMIYYGCKAAKGLTSENVIVDNIFTNVFEPKSLVRRDNPQHQEMAYWGAKPAYALLPSTLLSKDLLKYENGRCGGWSALFKDFIETQGIQGVTYNSVTINDALTPLMADIFDAADAVFGVGSDPANPVWIQYFGTPNITGPTDMFIKKWEFEQGSNSFYLWTDEYYSSTYPHYSGTSITSPEGVGINSCIVVGKKAQGNEDPKSTFFEHQFCKFNGSYFDPSYGIRYTDALDWEDKSIVAFGRSRLRVIYTDPNGILVDTYICFTTKLQDSFILETEFH